MDSAQKMYSVNVAEVYSGDDLILMVDLGVEDLWKRVRARLHGVDTPNAVKEKGNTIAGSIRERVRDLVRHKRGRIVVVNRNDRNWVVRLEIESPQGAFCLNDLLIKEGYVYTGPKKKESAT